MSAVPVPAAPPHRWYEDALALLAGTLFVAFGLALFQRAGLLTGGTAGIALLAHYASGWPFGALFFTINLPFYALAWRRMGPAFTVKTFAAVSLLALQTTALPRWASIGAVDPWFAALAGGLLMGTGFLVLFRHKASLGGLNVLVLFLQQRFGWRAGWVQMAIDGLIVATAFAWVEPARVALSVLGAVVLNVVLALNHRPGRYAAF